MIRIGILAVQGAFLEHQQMLEKLGVETFEIRQKKDLEEQFDGLILPGGESTVIGKLLHELELFEPIKNRIEEGLPVFGTCAGLLLLAKSITNDSRTYLGTMDICARRNAYGRQLGSFYSLGAFENEKEVPMIFIRAPFIEKTGENVQILGMADDKIVAARQGNQLVTAYHPELSKDTTIHQYFIHIVREHKGRLSLNSH